MLERIDQQPLPDHLAAQRQQDDRSPVLRPERLAQQQRDPQHDRSAGQARPGEQGPAAQIGPRALQQQDVKGIKEACEQAEQIAGQRLVVDLEAPAEQDRRSAQRSGQRQSLGAVGPALHREHSPGHQDQAARIAEQRGVAKARLADPDVPGGNVEREEHARADHYGPGPGRKAGQRLAVGARQQQQQRHCQDQAPEAGGHWPRIRKAHRPRTDRQRHIAANQRREVPTVPVRLCPCCIPHRHALAAGTRLQNEIEE